MDTHLNARESSKSQSEESTLELPESVMDDIGIELDEFAHDLLKRKGINMDKMNATKFAMKIAEVKDAWWDVFYAMRKQDLEEQDLRE